MPASTASRQTRPPSNKQEAITRASVIDGSRGRNAQLNWYYSCIHNMLEESRCPSGMREDVAHDLLLHRLEVICRSYDRSKGRFRPYLYRCVSNYWRDQLRAQRSGSQDRHRPLDADAGIPAPDAADEPPPPRPDLGELNEFLDRLFARFMRDMTRQKVGFFLFRDWCLTGRDVEAAIAEHGLGLAPAYARKLRAQAIAEFARFAEERLDPEDLAEMAEAARHDGQSPPADRKPLSISGLMRWPSESKRLGITARVLRHLYNKYRLRGASFDEL